MQKTLVFVALTISLGLLQSAGPAAAIPLSVANPSFETAEPVQGFPSTFGDWGVDLSAIVLAENGITPFDGSNMLKFINTGILGGGGDSADVGQAIDLTPHAALIAGGATVNASAYFNRVPGNAQTDTQFIIALRSFNTNNVLAAFDGTTASTASASASLISDSNASTWEKLTAQLVLPTDTTFIIMYMFGFENVSPNSSPELDGHYADLVSASVNSTVPLPAALPMFAAGLCALGLLVRRRRGNRRNRAC
jgi:hypothetical protein